MYAAGMEKNVVSMTSPDRRLTYDDLCRMPDDGLRHEIIDGVHYVTPAPNLRHQELALRLSFEIELYLRQHSGTGQVFFAPLDVLFTKWDVVEPDVLLVTADQTNILTADNIQGPPALVMEIVSPTTRKRDEQIKRRLFDRGSVREYWIVDPRRDAVTVFRRAADDSFPRVAELTHIDRDVLTTPLLPGFSLALTELFA
jgi:Uma2 family endonuclease